MANQIPLSESVNAAGGYLVPAQLADMLIKKVNRQAAALSLADVTRISTNRATWPVYLGRPTAEFVGEGADKPITGAEYSDLTVNIKKLATFVVYTDELLEDARIDPTVLINDDVEQAFADLIDYHMLGTHAGGSDTTATFGTSFDAAILQGAMTVELGTGQDAFALAVSEAMEKVEANGYMPGGCIAAFDAKRTLRDARDGDGRPLYREGFSGEVPTIEGLRLAYTTNLDGFPAGLVGGTGSPAKTVAVVGDFSASKAVIRSDLTTKTFTEATIGSHNLARQNKTAVRWEMRMGHQIFDPGRTFCRIINGS